MAETKMFVHGKYFYGNEISEYGQKHGYVDYRTLAKAFDAVMNNSIMEKTMEIGYWEQESGFVDHTEEVEELEEQQNNYPEIYQYFIVDGQGAEILKEINEIVFYNDALDMYVWGVTHWGTSWDYVLTDIRCNVPYEEE